MSLDVKTREIAENNEDNPVNDLISFGRKVTIGFVLHKSDLARQKSRAGLQPIFQKTDAVKPQNFIEAFSTIFSCNVG